MSNFIISTGSADGLALQGALAFAGTLIIKSKSHNDGLVQERQLKGHLPLIDADTGIFSHSASKYYFWPKTMYGIVMLCVWKNPFISINKQSWIFILNAQTFRKS